MSQTQRPLFSDPLGHAHRALVAALRRTADSAGFLPPAAEVAGARMMFRHACVQTGYPDARLCLTGTDGSILWHSPVRNIYLLSAKGHIEELTQTQYEETWRAMHAALQAANPGLESR